MHQCTESHRRSAQASIRLGDYKLGKAGSACDQAAPLLSPPERERFRSLMSGGSGMACNQNSKRVQACCAKPLCSLR